MKVEYGKTGTYFYWVGLILLAVFLPTSKFGLSVTQFYLVALWFLLGADMRNGKILSGIWHNIKTRFNDFIHNKVAVAMASMYLLHIVGLIYTSDFQYALKDLRIKLPILAFPLILSSMKPLSKKQFDAVIWFFIGSVFFVTVLGAIKFFRRDFVDVRELSVFVSHIRVSLCMVFSIFVLGYYLVKRNYSIVVKVIIVLLMMWFLWQITIWESFISILIIATLCAVMLIYSIFKSSNKFIKVSTLVVMFVAAVAVIYAPYKIIHDYNNPEEVIVEQLDTYTKLGNPYVFDTINLGIEDGRYVGLYLSKGELISAWNKRSEKRINHEYEDAYFCLVRYMTSRDLRKDAEGVSMLTDEDVRNIENNVANYNYIENPGIKTRIMKIMVAYNNYSRNGDANGSSVFQRIEFIKASLGIIKESPIFGVGTGDIVNAFADYYENTDSKLRPEYRFRSHNQYLAITVAFGVVGLLWFLFSMLYPILADKKNRNYIYFVFLFIMMLSMFTEDTIETQIGVTIFAFFNSFLVFGRGEEGIEGKRELGEG